MVLNLFCICLLVSYSNWDSYSGTLKIDQTGLLKRDEWSNKDDRTII